MSIYKRAKNNYRFRVTHKKIKYETTFYGSEREVKKAHEDFIYNVKNGAFKQDYSDMTVRELWQFYLDSKDLQANTVKAHNVAQNSFNFLDMKVNEITKAFLKDCHNKNKNFKNDDNFRLLKAVLKFGVEMDILSVNPLSFQLRKTKRLKFQEVMSLSDLQKLIKAIFNLESKIYRNFFLLQLFCGLRYGECAGIKRNNIDTTNHILSVREQYKLTDTGMGLGSLKTEYSSRDVYIPELIRSSVYELLLSVSDDEVIFKHAHQSISLGSINKKLKKLCQSLDIPIITSHKLRKLSATMLIYAGADTLSISANLGHSSLNMTEHYLTNMKDKKLNEIKKIDDFIKNLS